MSTIQEHELERIKRFFRFNDADGAVIAQSLRDNPHLWDGVVLDRLGSLIKLRDIRGGFWNVDTLYILPHTGREAELRELAESCDWAADEVDWIGGEEACSLLGSYSPEGRANARAILRVWWD